MNMAGFRLRTAADQLGALLTVSSRHARNPLLGSCIKSTQRYSGDHSTIDGTSGNSTQSYTIKILEKKAAKLEEEVRDLKERYRRAVADSVNVRKKTQKFVEDAKLFGIQSFCRDLVEVADIVEQATERASEEGMTDMTDVLSQVDEKLQSIFTKHGLEKMTPIGSNYDPYDHEVVCHVPAEGRKLGSVASIRQDGYKLHGRTIRHAHVGLAVASPE
ncbi:grpE protein homolog 2, mitochondrial [Pelodytes ibericus]